MGSQRAPNNVPDGGLEQALQTLEGNPGATGAMYPGWVADQSALVHEKGVSGEHINLADRESDIADDQLRRHLKDLADIVRVHEEQSDAEALKGFLETIFDGGSPADIEGRENDFVSEDEKRYYGKEGHGAPAPTGAATPAARAVEVEDGDEDEDESEKKSEAVLTRIVSVLTKLDHRLSALEAGVEARPTAGRSIEAARAATAVQQAAEAAKAAKAADAEGIYRRGGAVDKTNAVGLFHSEAISLLSNTQDYSRGSLLKQEVVEALSDMQVGLPPILNDPQLQAIAKKLGLAYRAAGGSPEFGGSE